MRNPVLRLAYDSYRDKAVVSLAFEEDFALINKIKALKSIDRNEKTHERASTNNDVPWSQSRGFWHIPRSEFKLSKVFDALQSVAYLDYSGLKENAKSILNAHDKAKDKITLR